MNLARAIASFVEASEPRRGRGAAPRAEAA